MKDLIEFLLVSDNYKYSYRFLNESGILSYNICKHNPDFLNYFNIESSGDLKGIYITFVDLEDHNIGSSLYLHKAGGFYIIQDTYVCNSNRFDDKNIIGNIFITKCQNYLESYKDIPNYINKDLTKIIEILKSGDYKLGIELLKSLKE